MKFPVLYKYTTTGATQQWQIVVKDDSFYTIEGLKDGKLTTSLPTYCKGKNIGKKNETTDKEQAIAEAKAKHQKKLDKGYNEVLTKEKPFFEPMLAHEYNKEKIPWGKTRVFVQPKLDGLRCVSEEGTLMSRNGKPYLACPHLYQGDTLLDGELYTHEYKRDFNKIVSLCKKQKPTKDELAESKEKVQYWVYDYPWAKTEVFSSRYEQLKEWVENQDNKSIVLVPTYKINSHEELEMWHGNFIEEGYEGTIVRLDNCEYEGKRSKSLLKYKDFVDEEFVILGAEEGEGGRAGTIGKFLLDLGDGTGKTFKSNVKGDFDYLKDIWKNHKKYIGKKATVKYFQRTPDNVPRFPYIIKFDRESYE